mmetsp:Transcript_136237/g.345003  ORF Transcript_136237/g.345003 Transcript_136237/m.345003 type:complete len:425 (-) Transcript_136237:196-1470(-)
MRARDEADLWSPRPPPHRRRRRTWQALDLVDMVVERVASATLGSEAEVRVHLQVQVLEEEEEEEVVVITTRRGLQKSIVSGEVRLAAPPRIGRMSGWRTTILATVAAVAVAGAAPAAGLEGEHQQQPGAAAPFSLANALGLSFGQQGASAVTDALEVPPGLPLPGSRPSTPTLAAVPEVDCDSSECEDEADVFIFGLTLRVAEGGELGITTSSASSADNGMGCAGNLRIEDVKAGGAVEAWNRQCGNNGAKEKVLHPGDLIVRVNDIADDPGAMLHACKTCVLLRLQVLRLGGSRVSRSDAGTSLPASSKAAEVVATPADAAACVDDVPAESSSCTLPRAPSLRSDAVVFEPGAGASVAPPPVPSSLIRGHSGNSTGSSASIGSGSTTDAGAGTMGSVGAVARGGGGCRRGRRGARGGKDSRSM